MRYKAVLKDLKGFTKEMWMQGSHPRECIEIPILPEVSLSVTDSLSEYVRYQILEFRLVRVEREIEQVTMRRGIPQVIGDQVTVGETIIAYYEEEDNRIWEPADPPEKPFKRQLDLRKRHV